MRFGRSLSWGLYHCDALSWHICALLQVRSKGERLRSKLREALGHNPHVKEVRGLGLICGIQLDVVRATSRT